MKFTTALISLATLPFTSTLAATITLYAVKPANTATTPTVSVPPGSITINAIGTDANGATTYVDEEVASVFVDVIATLNGGFYTSDGVVTTSTVSSLTSTYTTSAPLTRHATLVADSTHISMDMEPVPSGSLAESVGEHLNCVIDENKNTGSCVEEFWQAGEEFGTTHTTSWSGTLSPIWTITAGSSASTSTSKPNSGMPRLTRESCVGWGMFVVGSLSAWLLLL